MRFSKKSLEGEILIDHRASPGLDAEMALEMGVDPAVVAKGQLFEAPTITCAHCQAMVIVNPNRSRERAWCSKCDKYICDECQIRMHLTLRCDSRERKLDNLKEEVAQGLHPLFLTKL